jgi:hypothetical protein
VSGGGAAPADQESIAKHAALGYLGEDGVSAGEAAGTVSTATPRVDTPPTPTLQPATVTRSQINNLAIIKTNEKKYDEPGRLLRQAITMSPAYADPHISLRRIYMETGQDDLTDTELWDAIDKGFHDPERTLDRAAANYESLSMPDRAEVLLVRAIENFPEREPFYVHLMVIRIREGRFCGGVAGRGGGCGEVPRDRAGARLLWPGGGERGSGRGRSPRDRALVGHQPRPINAVQSP